MSNQLFWEISKIISYTSRSARYKHQGQYERTVHLMLRIACFKCKCNKQISVKSRALNRSISVDSGVAWRNWISKSRLNLMLHLDKDDVVTSVNFKLKRSNHIPLNSFHTRGHFSLFNLCHMLCWKVFNLKTEHGTNYNVS